MAMDEMTQLWYLRPSPLFEKEKPYHIFEKLPERFKTSNLAYERGPEQLIVDVRGREDNFTLEENGFAFRTRAPPSLNWDDEAEINAKYIPDIKELAAEMLGVGERMKICEIFDWRVRGCHFFTPFFKCLFSEGF